MRKLLKDCTKHPNPNNLLPARFNEKVIKDFWEALNTECDEQQRRLIKKSMRWTTLGYHYDWTNKIYDENFKNEFPPDLNRLIATIAEALNFKNYKSEAAIINFYPIGSTLSAHTDHSEFFLDSPLFSISFGQAAIFLIGGTEREDKAIPVLLNSGDVLIMSTESRLCYHAVPRVFKCQRNVWNDDENLANCDDLDQTELFECIKEENWKPFETYLRDSRINVNVRQVNK
jgi:alkylated DNA repair protein alkB homolog 1